MYHFIDLTDAQKATRRERLDWYASAATISVFVPLIWTKSFILVDRLRQSWAKSNNSSRNAPGSPQVKQSRLNHHQSIADRWRKFAWWCGDELHVAGWDLGTKGQLLGAGGWAVWLVMLCLLDTGDDYLHMTKRFGIVAASQLPWHYLLSIKSPGSPLQWLTGRSHESLVAIHQLLGRIVTVLLCSHSVLYLNFFVQKGLLWEKLTQLYVLCGVFGMIAFTAIGTTALKPVRIRSYQVFYITHVVLATALLPVLWFHVKNIRVYIYETLGIYALNVLLRLMATKTYAGSIRPVKGTTLIEINIPLMTHEALGERSGKLSGYQPGQHAYISLPGHPLSRTFRSNPFTVASVPSVDGHLTFIARILDGNTAKLANSPTLATPMLSVEGPYGLATHSEMLLGHDRVLFVAGGVGATFIMPLYRQLLSDLSPSKGSQRRQRVKFVWAARSMADVAWAFPADEREKDGLVERLAVYLTRNAAGVGADEDENAVGGASEEEGIELEERRTLLLDDEKTSTTTLSAHAGRPDLRRIVEQTFSHNNTERVAVVVCGPKSLSRALRREVGRWIGRGKKVWFWDESFST